MLASLHVLLKAYALIVLPLKVIKSDTVTAELNEPKLCAVKVELEVALS
jgi:hypothetical protein